MHFLLVQGYKDYSGEYHGGNQRASLGLPVRHIQWPFRSSSRRAQTGLSGEQKR